MKRVLSLFAFALLLIAVRLFVATTAPDVFQRGEEYVRGAAALAIGGDLLDSINQELAELDEPKVGVEALFYHPYEGGGFIHALLTAPVFAIMGPSLLAHKLVAILVELMVLFAGLWLIREVFGRKAELPFVLLLIFAPLAIQKIALLNLGIHYQALVFQYALAALGLGALRGKPRAFRMGFVAGFGLFYNYQLAPLIGLLGLALLWRRSLDLSHWRRLAWGFAMGGLPLWWMIGCTGLAMLNIHGQFLGQNDAGAAGLLEVFTSLTAALDLRGFTQLVLLLGLALYAGLSSPGPARLVLGYLVIFGALIPFSGFLFAGFSDYFGAMRYAPLFGFASLLAAGSASQVRRPALAHLGLSLLLLLGISSTASAARYQIPSRIAWQRIASTHGVDFTSYFSKLYQRLPTPLREDDSACLRAFTRIIGAPRAQLLPSATAVVARHTKTPLARMIASLQEVAPNDWQLGLLGFGGWTTRRRPKSFIMGQRFLKAKFRNLPEALFTEGGKHFALEQMLEGIGRNGTGTFPTIEVLRSEVQQIKNPKQEGSICLGLGWRAAHALRVAPSQLDMVLEGFDKQVAEFVLTGFEQAQHALRISSFSP